jgi:hypothetical protein
MPSNKPRVTLYFDNQEMEILEAWAGQEFLTVPQLTRVVVKRAIAEYLKQHPRETVEDVPEPEPPKAKTAATTKQGRGKGKAG